MDVSKQLVTLATAIITLTITFSKEIVGTANLAVGDQVLAGAAWGTFLISLLSGIWCLYGLAGSVSKVEGGAAPTIYDSNVAIPMGIQQVTFVIAMILTIIFGVRVL